MPATAPRSRSRFLRRRLGWVIAIIMALGATLAAIFSPAAILNALAPMGGVTRETDIRYGDAARTRLDLYLPEQTVDAPIVVFVYGGSWQGGHKETYKFVGAALARRGMIVVIPDYTVYPEGRFPRFLEDAASAVAWTVDWARRNHASRGTNARRIVLMGHSAGAHIAAMLAFDARWLSPHGLDPRRDVAGFVGLAGPYDFLPIVDPVIKIIFDQPDLRTTQPITFVEGGEAPVFVGFAPADKIVLPGNSERLAARLRDKGTPVEVRTYPRTNHLSLIGSFSPLLTFLAPVADDVTTFIHGLSPTSGN